MEILFLIKTTYIDLKRNRIRTLLTSLGILIGVFSVVTLIAMGIGLQSFIQAQFQKIGTNLVIVFPGNFSSGDGGGFQDSEGGFGSKSFDLIDAKNLEKVKSATYIVPSYIKVVKLEAAGESKNLSLFASTADIFPVQKSEINSGQFFTESDVSKSSKVVVLGSVVAKEIFGNPERALKKTIRIDNQRFTVKGVLKEKGGGGLLGRDFDTFIYTPYTAAYVFNPKKEFVAFYIQAKSEDDIEAVKAQVKEIMDKRYDEQDYSVIGQTEILGTMKSIFQMVNLVLVAIGSVSLVVGGIGIMNIMYASVIERTTEVGIRRALGATKSDILNQFLSEAIAISVFGGLLGLGLASIGVSIANNWFPAQINSVAVGLALGVSAVIGITFGVFPARKAANLQPIEAIRKR